MIERFVGRLARALASCRIPYMMIGGQAVLFYGYPRLTQDVDITLGVDIDAYPKLKAMCRELGLRPAVKNPDTFIRRTRVLPAVSFHSGFRVDFVFSNTPYEREAIRRARSVRIGQAKVKIASLEDVLIHKLVAGRPIDREDTRVLLMKHRRSVDRLYVRRWLKQFARLGTLRENPLAAFDGLFRSV